ncbi:MAG: VF530 family protein [Candidatus Thiodiazotropha sp.]
MNDGINYKNNPLNGVGLKRLLTELVNHYGFEILYAYLNINCFKANPSIDSSVKFLKKTQWAREKVEAFYLYEFKNLPKPPSDQYSLSPRARIIPDDQKPGEPAELSLQTAKQLREERQKKAAEWSQSEGRRSGAGKRSGVQKREYSSTRYNNRSKKTVRESSNTPGASVDGKSDPWAKWRKTNHE